MKAATSKTHKGSKDSSLTPEDEENKMLENKIKALQSETKSDSDSKKPEEEVKESDKSLSEKLNKLR